MWTRCVSRSRANPTPFPTLELKKADSIFDYDMDDILASQGYQHHPAIHAPVAV